MPSYSRAQRRELEAALRNGEQLRCPECGGVISRQDVQPAANVPYVRHRAWLMCVSCKRSVSVDLK